MQLRAQLAHSLHPLHARHLLRDALVPGQAPAAEEMRSERDRWAKVIKQTGAGVD